MGDEGRSAHSTLDGLDARRYERLDHLRALREMIERGTVLARVELIDLVDELERVTRLSFDAGLPSCAGCGRPLARAAEGVADCPKCGPA